MFQETEEGICYFHKTKPWRNEAWLWMSRGEGSLPILAPLPMEGHCSVNQWYFKVWNVPIRKPECERPLGVWIAQDIPGKNEVEELQNTEQWRGMQGISIGDVNNRWKGKKLTALCWKTMSGKLFQCDPNFPPLIDIKFVWVLEILRTSRSIRLGTKQCFAEGAKGVYSRVVINLTYSFDVKRGISERETKFAVNINFVVITPFLCERSSKTFFFFFSWNAMSEF